MVSDFLISLLQEFGDANVLTKTTAISTLAFLVIAPSGVIVARYRRCVTRLQEEHAEL
jgi:preprotein translocase subunit SecG